MNEKKIQNIITGDIYAHVDYKIIVQDHRVVSAIPLVTVNHPKAHITHETSRGRVDAKQLQTLMARGLSEEEAIDMVIQGILI